MTERNKDYRSRNDQRAWRQSNDATATKPHYEPGPPVEDVLREYRSLGASINATFTNKVRRGIFNPVARNVSGYVDAEDRLQDAIAQTWQLYRRNAEAGRILDDALLVRHCKLRAIDPGRSIVRASARSSGLLRAFP